MLEAAARSASRGGAPEVIRGDGDETVRRSRQAAPRLSGLVRWGSSARHLRGCVKAGIPAIVRGRSLALGGGVQRRPNGRRGRRHPAAYPGYEDVLDDPDVDAVYIPLPNDLHRTWVKRALEAGKHVLCEKPLASSAAEAVTMGRAADAHGRLLMEALMYRFHPRSLRVRELVAGGAIGRPRLVHAAFCFSMDPEALAAGTGPRLRPEMGGGALLTSGATA